MRIYTTNIPKTFRYGLDYTTWLLVRMEDRVHGKARLNKTKYEQILIKIGQCDLPSIAKSKKKPWAQ